MSRLLKAIDSGRVLLMDGAMGTQLQRGSGRPECYELWNLTRPDVVRAIHQHYAASGAEILLTNTFQANPAALTRHGCSDRLEAIFEAALANARTAAGAERFVLADVGPMENIDVEAASRLIALAISADGLFLETWSDPGGVEIAANVLANGSEGELPLLVSFTFGRPKRRSALCTFTGSRPEACARAVQQTNAVALGVNCGRNLSLDDYLEVIHRYQNVTDLPIMVRPNAGTPICFGDKWEYPRAPGILAAWIQELLEAGVRMIGGCCGTTPEHIAAFRSVIDEWNARNDES